MCNIQQTEREDENRQTTVNPVLTKSVDNSLGKSLKETESKGKQTSAIRQGRWSKEEHFRFLEALKLYGKEWRKVQ